MDADLVLQTAFPTGIISNSLSIGSNFGNVQSNLQKIDLKLSDLQSPNQQLPDLHLTDEQAMALAIREAFKGAGKVSPNPLVGCVILSSENKLLSVGHHPYVGGPHAEVMAIQNLQHPKLKNARVFVTLEPCAHEGRTPSCAKMLAKTNIAEVIYGLQDPNPLVAGQGAEILKQAGKKVVLYQGLKEALEQTCEHFLWNFRQKKVFVSLKVATSLDGQLAHFTGESKWITGEGSRQYAHYLRAFHDALMVGVGTVLQDNPSLNIRHPMFPGMQKKLIVVDKDGDCLKNKSTVQNIFQAHSPENLVFVVRHDLKDFVKNQGFACISLDLQEGHFVWSNMLSALWDLGIRSLMVEGGAQLISSVLQSSAWQRLFLFQAPVILGGRSGITWSREFQIPNMQDQVRLLEPQYKQIEKDILITGKYGR